MGRCGVDDRLGVVALVKRPVAGEHDLRIRVGEVTLGLRLGDRRIGSLLPFGGHRVGVITAVAGVPMLFLVIAKRGKAGAA